MSLFSDGPPSTVNDLMLQDSFLLSVTNTEGIDVTSKLQLAFDEVGIELVAIFDREASIYTPVLGQAPLDLNHLSVTPALKLWHTFKCLELVYRDAYFNQLNDRYKAKWAEYQSQASWSRSKFIDTGAGLVIDPLPLPNQSVTSFQPGTASGGMVYMSITITNTEGEESSPTSPVQVAVPDQQQMVVTAPTSPANATGWNVYLGISPALVTLQNSSPLPIGTSWILTFPVLMAGKVPGVGQTANVTRDLPRRIMRG